MPRYSVTERFYSKKTRSNDFSGNVAFIPKVFISIDFIGTITLENSTVTWTSNKVPTVNLSISYDGQPFETIAENIVNTGQYQFTQQFFSQVTIFRVESATNPEIRDDSNPFIYDRKLPINIFYFAHELTTAPVMPDDCVFYFGEELT